MRSSSKWDANIFSVPYVVVPKGISRALVKSVVNHCDNLKLAPAKVQKDRSSRKLILEDHRKCSVASAKLPQVNKLVRVMVNRVNRVSWNFREPFAIESAQYALYRRGHFFNWHNDSFYKSNGKKLKNERVVTVVILLSDPKEFRGGCLEIVNAVGRRFKVPIKRPGDVAIFPSFLVHRVTRVDAGKRRTLTLWFLGPHKIKHR